MEPWVHPTAAALAVGTPVAAHSAASPGAPQSKTQDPEPAAMCRICYGESEEKILGPDRALICPCLCKGTVKHVHVDCLRTWQRTCGISQGRQASQVCDMCKSPYKLPGRPAPSLRQLLRLLLDRLTSPALAADLALDLWVKVVLCGGAWGAFAQSSSCFQTHMGLGLSIIQHRSSVFPGMRQLPQTLLGLVMLGAFSAEVLTVSLTAAYLHALLGFASGSASMMRRTARGALRGAVFASGRALGFTTAAASFLLL